MKQWNGKVTVFGEDRTYVFDVVADISNKLYERAMECYNRGEGLGEDIRKKIADAIYASFDIEEYIEYDEWMMLEKPEREDCESDEEYEEALEEFEEEKEKYYDNFCIDRITVEDKGLFLKLKKQFCGKKISDGWDGEETGTKEIREELSGNDGLDTTTLVYEINSKGILVDIKQIYTVTLGSDDCKGGSVEEIEPDYYEAEEYFQELVYEYEDDYEEDDEE